MDEYKIGASKLADNLINAAQVLTSKCVEAQGDDAALRDAATVGMVEIARALPLQGAAERPKFKRSWE